MARGANKVKNKTLLGFLVGALVTGALVGCGPKDSTGTEGTTGSGEATAPSNLSGAIMIDGSTTVYPIAQILAEDFGKANSGVKLTVNKSGTGSGFKSGLSRPSPGGAG